jgi:hypothetical protein
MGSSSYKGQSAGTVLVQISYPCAYELLTALQNALGQGGGKKKNKKNGKGKGKGKGGKGNAH